LQCGNFETFWSFQGILYKERAQGICCITFRAQASYTLSAFHAIRAAACPLSEGEPLTGIMISKPDTCSAGKRQSLQYCIGKAPADDINALS